MEAELLGFAAMVRQHDQAKARQQEGNGGWLRNGEDLNAVIDAVARMQEVHISLVRIELLEIGFVRARLPTGRPVARSNLSLVKCLRCHSGTDKKRATGLAVAQIER